jgi:hypothetical protein
VDNLLLYINITKALESGIMMTPKSDDKVENSSKDFGWKRLGYFLRDTAMAAVVMPLVLVAVSSALSLLMLFLW